MSKAQELSSVFDAAQSISFAAGEGIDFGGASLDDYEEGTWTPVIFGSSGSAGSYAAAISTGRYTRIGNRVWATGFINISDLGSWGNSVKVTLPFLAQTTEVETGFVGTAIHEQTFGTGKFLAPIGGTAESFVRVNNDTGFRNYYYSDLRSGSTNRFVFTLHYVTSA